MSSRENLWKQALVSPDVSVQEAISNLNDTAIQVVLVVNAEGGLVGTLSDGDIRRGLLKGMSLSSSIKSIVHTSPLVVPEGLDRNLILGLMTANSIHQIPIVDQNNRVLGVHLWDSIQTPLKRDNLMVIMAGGRGSRLGKLTESCPKPMLHIGGKPILEHIIERAKFEGFSRFVMSTHYLGYVIEQHFSDGAKFGVQIEYLNEASPLGTAGALSLLDPIPELPFVVTNGDVLSDIKYGELLDFHCRHNAEATMAVRVHEWQHPFGVVNVDGIAVTGFEEKPIIRSHINAGVYAFSSNAINYLEKNVVCDMPGFFEILQANNKLTVAYPMHEPWLDVGMPNDLALARKRL